MKRHLKYLAVAALFGLHASHCLAKFPNDILTFEGAAVDQQHFIEVDSKGSRIELPFIWLTPELTHTNEKGQTITTSAIDSGFGSSNNVTSNTPYRGGESKTSSIFTWGIDLLDNPGKVIVSVPYMHLTESNTQLVHLAGEDFRIYSMIDLRTYSQEDGPEEKPVLQSREVLFDTYLDNHSTTNTYAGEISIEMHGSGFVSLFMDSGVYNIHTGGTADITSWLDIPHITFTYIPDQAASPSSRAFSSIARSAETEPSDEFETISTRADFSINSSPFKAVGEDGEMFTVNPSPVPEPSAVILALAGLGIACVMARRH